jgi:hypothetical protein
MKLTDAGKFRLEEIRIAMKKDTRETVVFDAIRELGEKHGIVVPSYTNDDVFTLVRRGMTSSGNVRPLNQKSRGASIVLPLVGDIQWYNLLKRKLGASTFGEVVKQAMSDYDSKHMS